MIKRQKTWFIPSAIEFDIRLFTGFIAIHSVAKKIMSPHSLPVISIFKFLAFVLLKGAFFKQCSLPPPQPEFIPL